MRPFAIAVVILGAAAGTAHAQPCTVQLPAGSDLQAAIDAALPGDVVCLDPGLYAPAGQIDIDKPLTLRGPRAGVDPRPSAMTTRTAGDALTEAVIDGGGASGLVVITADDVVLEGLELRNVGGDLIDSEASVPTSGLELRYNILHGSGDEAVQLRASSAPSILYNHVYATAGDGINVCCGSTMAVVRFNELHDIASLNAAIYLYDDTFPQTPIDAVITDNLVYDVTVNDGIKLGDSGGADAALAGGGILDNVVHDTREDCITVYSSQVLVDGNECYNSSSANGGVFVDFAVDSIVITGNDIHDNGVAGDGRTTYGVRIGKDAFPTNVVVNNNTIRRNEEGLIYVFAPGAPSLDARFNYWGSSLGPSGVGGNATSLGDSVTENVLFEPFTTACEVGTCPAGGGGDPFLRTLQAVLAVIDDPATPPDVGRKLEEEVLERVKKAFEEFLKGHPHHMAEELDDGVKKLQEIAEDQEFHTLGLQAELSALAIELLADLNHRVETVIGPSASSLAFSGAALDQAEADFFAGDYRSATQAVEVGADEVHDPDYAGNFCSGATPASYSDFVCALQSVRDDVDAMIVDDDGDSDQKRLRGARSKLADAAEKLAVVGVKDAAKKSFEAGKKLADLELVDAGAELAAITDVMAALVREFLIDAAASGHDPDGVEEAEQRFAQAESARLSGQRLLALELYAKAADKASP